MVVGLGWRVDFESESETESGCVEAAHEYVVVLLAHFGLFHVFGELRDDGGDFSWHFALEYALDVPLAGQESSGVVGEDVPSCGAPV